MVILKSLLKLSTLINAPIAASLFKKNIPLVSFFASSIIATGTQNVLLSPVITEAAWTIFLQSSLILGIWSKYDQFQNQSIQRFIQSNISILIAFILGSFGSYIGGFIGFTVASMYVKHSTILSRINNIASSAAIIQLKMIASCITASYIGGTANFFETSDLLLTKFNAHNDVKKSLNAVAGIDIGIMVAYFSFITSIQAFYSRFQNKSGVYDKSRSQSRDSNINIYILRLHSHRHYLLQVSMISMPIKIPLV